MAIWRRHCHRNISNLRHVSQCEQSQSRQQTITAASIHNCCSPCAVCFVFQRSTTSCHILRLTTHQNGHSFLQLLSCFMFFFIVSFWFDWPDVVLSRNKSCPAHIWRNMMLELLQKRPHNKVSFSVRCVSLININNKLM